MMGHTRMIIERLLFISYNNILHFTHSLLVKIPAIQCYQLSKEYRKIVKGKVFL